MPAVSFRRYRSIPILVKSKDIISQVRWNTRKLIFGQLVDKLGVSIVGQFVHTGHRRRTDIQIHVCRLSLPGLLGGQERSVPIDRRVEAFHKKFLSLWSRSAERQYA